MKNKFSSLLQTVGRNYFSEDIPLQNMIQYFKMENAIDDDLVKLGNYVSSELMEIMDFVDHKGKPELITWDIDGQRIDLVRIAPEQRKAMEKIHELGVVRKSCLEIRDWNYHFISGYIISDPGIFCTFTLTAQTAYCLGKYLGKDDKNLMHYVNKEDPWYGATFYSEKQGGSDLALNDTMAIYDGKSWKINGKNKYFASNAGIADGSLVTAKIGEGGVRSLALFFVPSINSKGDLNFTIRRLKDKMGTIAVPSGEVEFEDSECVLIGEQKYGIYYALEILNISRINDSIAANGISRKALWEAYIHCKKRVAFGKKLLEHPLMKKDLIEMEAMLEGSLALSLYASNLFSKITKSVPPYDDEYNYSRFITHIAKNMAAWAANDITQYAMEIFGGTGFFEEYPIAKFHRDALVTSIWEGTSNIQSLDMLESIVKKGTLSMFAERINHILDSNLKLRSLKLELDSILSFAEKNKENGTLEINSKVLLRKIGQLTEITLIGDLASRFERFEAIYRVLHAIYYQKEDDVDQSIYENVSVLSWMG